MNGIFKIIIGSLALIGGGLAIAASVWFLYIFLFPGHACVHLYSEQLSQVQRAVEAVLSFRREHGHLPSPSEIRIVGYFPDADGTFEVHFLSFDGPKIMYSERTGEYICEL